MPSIRDSLQRTALLLICSGCLLAVGESRPGKKGAFAPFERAERQREALEGRPVQQRTRAAYERVLDAYRAIYANEPAGAEAPAAVDAMASLLAEEGRGLHDATLLHAAIEQYEVLRRKYPASPFRQSALLSEAEIAQSDLGDSVAARKAFTEFLRLFPTSPLAGEARQQLKALPRAVAAAPAERAASGSAAEAAAHNRGEHARELAELNAAGAGRVQPAPATVAPAAAKPAVAMPAPVGATNHPSILITGIRHWSTPVYTRVAIDLSDEVQYEAARVPDPDRIYFDLHGARLAPELLGKSVDIPDDGFLHRVRTAQYSAGSTRVVLDVSHVSEYSAFFLPNPWRLIIDIHGTSAHEAVPAAQAGAVPASTAGASQTAAARADSSAQEVSSLARAPRRVKATPHPTTGPIAASVSGTIRAPQPNELDALSAPPPAPLVTDVDPPSAPAAPAHLRRRNSGANSSSSPAAPPAAINLPPLAREAAPTATGERSLVRALGLKIGRIVIDAGHGGHDSGTLGPEGIQEKDVVLDVSLRLGKLLKQRLGADVIYTRDDDTFIPLETRTAIANKAQADLFLSVHANSSSDPSARGVEVYYLNFTTSPEALEVAARENAVSDQSIYQLSDLVKKITLKDKIDESHEFAADVETSLYSGLGAGAVPGNEGLKDRGVKKAPFVVLIGANMPSVLAEISFLTNPDDARELRDPAYRQRIAESLYSGVSRYVAGLSGIRLAQRAGHDTGNE